MTNDWNHGSGWFRDEAGNLRKASAGTGLDAGGAPITNVTDPSAPQDAATKAYVDAHAGGVGNPLVSKSAYGKLVTGMPGLLAYLPMQEAAGPVAFDFGPRNFVAQWTAPDNVIYVPSGGPVTDEPAYVTVGGGSALLLSRFFSEWSGQYSVVCFGKTANGGTLGMFGNRATSGGGVALGMGGHGGGSGAGKLFGIVDDGGTAYGRNSEAVYNDDVWHHLVWTLGGQPGAAVTHTDFNLFADGVEVAPYADTSAGGGTHPIVGGVAGGLRLGGLNTDGVQSSAWIGSWTHMAIFRRRITPTEIAALHAARLA